MMRVTGAIGDLQDSKFLDSRMALARDPDDRGLRRLPAGVVIEQLLNYKVFFST